MVTERKYFYYTAQFKEKDTVIALSPIRGEDSALLKRNRKEQVMPKGSVGRVTYVAKSSSDLDGSRVPYYYVYFEMWECTICDVPEYLLGHWGIN